MSYVGLGGASVPPAVTERLDGYGIIAYRSYGSIEHPSMTGSHFAAPAAKRLYTDGAPLEGAEVRLGADGEVLSRGAELCLGYTDPALTAAAFDDEGWYHTGDLAEIDGDGYLTITGRRNCWRWRTWDTQTSRAPPAARSRSTSCAVTSPPGR